jgi:hypothetical protein
MAIITDPDAIGRFDVIFGTESQKVSIYPVGDTQRGATIINAYVSGTGAITNTDGTGWTGIVVTDVAAVLNTVNAGHYFVDAAPSTTIVTLVGIDTGTLGAAITSLVTDQKTFSAAAIASNVFTINGHGYVSGDAVVYTSLGGGTADTGMTLGTVYYIIWLSANTFSIATSYANALAGTALVTNDDGAGVSHTFDERLLVAVFNNGASAVIAATTPTGEFINGNETTGTDDGDIKDGITMQAIYSFGKDEWRVDSLITDLAGNWNDDLIRTEYPFEAITSEQFEVGGGVAHDNWSWFNDYTRKKVRTGGWADKTLVQTGALDLERWTGIVTLGSLDIDTQVYYQQVSAVTAKNDFTFTGVVNESVQILDDPNQDGAFGDGFDRTQYLKLFARKKGRSYAQSEIADIGVSTLQTIVNRFPLAHVPDAAIDTTDAEIFGTNPFKFGSNPFITPFEGRVVNAADGDKTAGALTFTSTGSTFFTSEVVAGDILHIFESGDTDSGYYQIASVDSETVVTVTDVEYVDADGNFVFQGTNGWRATSSTLDFNIYSSIILADKTTTPGTAADLSADTGIINVTPASVSAGALGSIADTVNDLSGAQAGDLLLVTGGVTDPLNEGIYKVVDANYDANAAAPAAGVLFVNTTDFPFPAVADTAASYQVLEPGMYLQFKDILTQTIVSSATANETIVFASSGRTITLGSVLAWDASIVAGTMIVVSGTSLNDGRFTVLSVNAQVVTLIATDTLTDETNTNAPVATVQVREGFRRTIGTGTFAYRWRVFGNNGGLQEVFQFIQNQLRDNADIDFGTGASVGNITDLLMSFASPTGTGLEMFIDDLNTGDINNATFQDHSGTNRNFPFTASGNLVFNSNLVADTDAKYWLFFSNDDAGINLGRDFGTKDALIVQDSLNRFIAGNVNGSGNHTGVAGTLAGGNISVPFTYDYDVNVQRGAGSAATDGPVTLVAIGLSSAQYVVAAGTITRATGITISAVAALERNYLQGTV